MNEIVCGRYKSLPSSKSQNKFLPPNPVSVGFSIVNKTPKLTISILKLEFCFINAIVNSAMLNNRRMCSF